MPNRKWRPSAHYGPTKAPTPEGFADPFRDRRSLAPIKRTLLKPSGITATSELIAEPLLLADGVIDTTVNDGFVGLGAFTNPEFVPQPPLGWGEEP